MTANVYRTPTEIRMSALETALARAAQDVLDFGSHTPPCPQWVTSGSPELNPCHCGYDRAKEHARISLVGSGLWEADEPPLVPTCFAALLGAKPPRRWWQLWRR